MGQFEEICAHRNPYSAPTETATRSPTRQRDVLLLDHSDNTATRFPAAIRFPRSTDWADCRLSQIQPAG